MTTNLCDISFDEQPIFQEEKELLKPENLTNTIFDLTLSEDIRLLALDVYYKTNNDLLEIISKLSSMYQLSGTKSLEKYIYAICTKSKIQGFYKTLLVKSLCSNNEESTIGYDALNKIYPVIQNELGNTYRIEMVMLLMECEKYKEEAAKYFKDIITNFSLDSFFRFKIILKVKSYFFKSALWELLHSKETTYYKILCSQHLLKKCDLNSDEKLIVENILLSFATDSELDNNLRADASDTLLHLGSDESKSIAKETIIMLGKTGGLTVYDNAQNVHNTELEESVQKAIEFVATLPTIYKEEEKEDSKCKKKVGTNIDFDFVQSKIHKIIKDFDKERISLIEVALRRIEIDRVLYSKYNCTLSFILVKIWSFIYSHECKDELMERLFQELEEMSGTCSSGYASRLVNIISGFSDFSLRISWRDQITANLTGRLNARIRKLPEETQSKVLDEMTIPSSNYHLRTNFLKFFRENYLSIREEMYQEFCSHITDTDFDLYFKFAVTMYESGDRLL